MKLYYAPAVCSLAPHIALRRAGATFELHRINIQKGEQHTDEFKAISPHAKVPVLLLSDGQTITESTVIAQYIAESFPDAQLLPTDTVKRAKARELMSWANATLHMTIYATIFRPNRFTDDEACQENLRINGKQRLEPALDFIDESLANRRWADPGQLTITDLFLYVYGRWAARVGASLDERPHFRDHMAWITGLPETKQALEAEGVPA